MVCQISMTQSERERKDGVPKKHDPQWGREKRWRTKEVRPKKMKEKRWRTKEVRPQKNGERISKEKELSSTL